MANLQRPPTRLYEIRTAHGETYRVHGDAIESGDGWFTLWTDDATLALRLPSADIRVVRQVPEGLSEAGPWAHDPMLAALVKDVLGLEMSAASTEQALFIACRGLEKSEAARAHIRAERDSLRAALGRVQKDAVTRAAHTAAPWEAR